MINKSTPQDLYETNPEDAKMVLDIIAELGASGDPVIYDPACGNKVFGNMFRENGFDNIIESDLFTMEEKTNYLTTIEPIYDILVTNPPYAKKVEWIMKAYNNGNPFIMLLPSDILFHAKAMKFFIQYGVTVYVPMKSFKFLHEGKWCKPLQSCSYFCGNFPMTEKTVVIKYVDNRGVNLPVSGLSLIDDMAICDDDSSDDESVESLDSI